MIATVPWAPLVLATIVSVSPSGSLSLALTASAVAPALSRTDRVASLTALGGSWTGVIVTLTVPIVVQPWPSAMVYVKVSAPLALAFGL